MNPKLIRRYILRETLGLVGMGVALFWPAGRLDWWPAWGALAVMLIWTVGMALIVFRSHPDLLAERLGPRPGVTPSGSKGWDAAILSTLGLVQLLRYIVAGLDQRYGWTGPLPEALQLAALVLGGLGYGLFLWAAAVNAFFSQLVRIQRERGHTVVSGGPYRYVRHPAYSGALLYELMVSVLLGSGWALLISGLSALLLILRTRLEDRVLQAELPGYAEYARRVRYRLLPGLW